MLPLRTAVVVCAALFLLGSPLSADPPRRGKLVQPAPTPEEPAPIEAGELRFAGAKVHFLEGGDPNGLPVVLLHGQRFTSETWRELGTLDFLVGQGFRVLALDLPGYGASEPSELRAEEYLASLLPLLTPRPAVVVSPSMSGRFSLPLVARRPGFVAGFVPVAPAAIDTYLDALEGSKVPTLLLWGENDSIIPPKQGEKLAKKLPGSRLVVFPGASHPCYLDVPIDFHRELLSFLRGLE
jgi:pimeloyl-ACP methyl ester carboxylesterase